MEGSYIRQKITELRIEKGVSEYKMSLDLGHSKSYIQSISSGRALPSLPEFLCICDYFGITPKDSFDSEITEPVLLNELSQTAALLGREDLEALIAVARRLGAKKEKSPPSLP